ncbi:HPr kinase/phosphorylase [bacterium]|nr:MAG: HPr kinase/phosphorylase [bacterium]
MPLGEIKPLPITDKFPVSDLIEKVKRKVIGDLEPVIAEQACSERFITEAELHRPGLALAGYLDLFTSQRIQVMGNTESQYLRHMSAEQQVNAFENLLKYNVPVIFLTAGNELPESLINLSAKFNTPIFKTSVETTRFMFLLRDYLDDQFAEQTMVHGSMVDVYGIGIMISGKSGIGKSEVALDLIERGHRLVADDVVMLTKKSNVLMASSSDMNGHFMEIRGLGIIDIMSMFGIRAVRYQKRLEVLVDLFLWDETSHIERTGLDQQTVNILGIEIPYVRLPISPGKNITVIAEVIAMNHLLKHYGYDAAKTFQEKIQQKIRRKAEQKNKIKRAVDYFESDFE